MNNINEKITFLNNEINSTKKLIKDMSDKVEKQEIEIKTLLKDYLNSSNELFKNAICNWVTENPILAIGYFKSVEADSRNIFFKNDNNYKELFGSDIYKKDEKYILTKKKDLSSIQVNTYNMIDYFEKLECGDRLSLELDFLNGLSIELIEENGGYLHENAWEISYNILNNISPQVICSIVKDEFSIYNYTNERDGILKFKKEKTRELLDKHNNSIKLEYKEDKTFSIYSNSSLVGFANIDILKGDEQTYYQYGAILESLDVLEGYNLHEIEEELLSDLDYIHEIDIIE